MGLSGPVLAGTDFSDAADAALRQGVEIASALATRLVICHVLPEAYRVRMLFPQDAGIDLATQRELEVKARNALQGRLDAVVAGTMVEIGVEIESGTAHAGILTIADRIRAGLIVVGPGRTAQHVARSSNGPVLIARPSPVGGSVLGATDFSDPSLPAVQMAADEARRRDVKLRVVHCLDFDTTAYVPPVAVPGMLYISPMPQPMIEQMEAAAHAQLREALTSADAAEGEAILQRRPPELGIVEAAEAVATAVVVVGTRGRTGLARLALGSVAETVVSRAPCSVLVVPLHPAH